MRFDQGLKFAEAPVSAVGVNCLCLLKIPAISAERNIHKPSQQVELSRSEFDPKLFSHSAYVKFLIFCDKMRQFFLYRKWIEREEIQRK